ncbi:hypothetical protein BDR22DRAFT_894661 [Usnea florida]
MDKHIVPVQVPMSSPQKTDNKSPAHVEQDLPSYDPTELARNQDAAGDVVSPFFKIPLEMRNQIYQYLLSTKYCKVNFRDADTPYLDELQYDDCKSVYQFHPAILVVNRQINHEAIQTVHGNFLVRVTLDFQFDTNSLPVLAKKDLACRVTYPAIEISIIDTEHSHLNADPWSLMFAGDDMTTFCRILSRRYPFPGSLVIAVNGVAQNTSVLKLLEPFRRIHGMASVKITGLIEDDYRSELIASMLKQAPDGDIVLQEIWNAIKEGDQAASIHDYSTAVSRFRKAFDETDDYWKIYDTADIIVESGVFNGQSLVIAFAQMLVILTTKIVRGNLKLKNFRQVADWHKWGFRDVIKRILRSEANRASDPLDMEVLVEVMSEYGHDIEELVEATSNFVDDLEAYAESIPAIEH